MESNQPSSDRIGRIPGTGVRLGYLGDTADQKLVSELYYQDKVVEAYERSLEVGAIGAGASLGFFRLIEGEALTRQVSEITDIDPHLKLEFNHPDRQALAAIVVAVCQEVAGRLGWNFEADTMISILVPEANVPWHSARYGYMMDKYPYDKVCLPADSISDDRHLRRVLAHEYAHVVTLNLTQNRAPHWVEEGISTLIEGPFDPASTTRFHTSESTWREPRDLENAFNAERRNGENREKIRDAYDQAHLLLNFLHQAQGDEGLKKFLRAFTDNSIWDEVKIQLGTDPADEALRQIYKITQADLFLQAKP